MKQIRRQDAAVALAPATALASAHDTSARYAEVWGDTVDLRHLGGAIVLGIGIGTGAFLAGKSLLASLVADAAIARAYAMLLGLGGCLLAGAVCARLFEPKRQVVEQASDASERQRVLDQLSAEYGGLGAITDLSDAARAELAELGLLELFAAREAAAARAVPVDGAAGAAGEGADRADPVTREARP